MEGILLEEPTQAQARAVVLLVSLPVTPLAIRTAVPCHCAFGTKLHGRSGDVALRAGGHQTHRLDTNFNFLFAQHPDSIGGVVASGHDAGQFAVMLRILDAMDANQLSNLE
jgi:hypothetical protein